MTNLVVPVVLSVATAASLYFARSRALRAAVVLCLLLVIAGQASMLGQTGRTLYSPERPTTAAASVYPDEADGTGALVEDTFSEGAFVALKSADRYVRPRVLEMLWLAFCLGLLALRSRPAPGRSSLESRPAPPT